MKRFATIVETVPTPCQVLGTVLRPFSLGHHFLFVRLGLPYADNPDADAEDVMQFFQAVFVCANTYKDNIEGHLSGEWSKRFEEWLKAVKKKQFNLKEAQAVFQKHLEDGYRMAPVWRHQVNGISLSAPWECLLKGRLVESGFSVDEVFEGYLPALWYDYFTSLELEAARDCSDRTKWKKVFYTFGDAMDDYKAQQATADIAPESAQDEPEQAGEGKDTPQAGSEPITESRTP